MSPRPLELSLDSQGNLVIRWDDGDSRQYTVRELRDHCPCATCREKRSAPPPSPTTLPVLTAAETAPLTLKSLTPVGSYAYSLGFSDGHDTGIYTLEQLKALGHAKT